MTPEDLERLVVAGDRMKLAEAVANLTEPERKKLSKTAQSVKHDIEQGQWAPAKQASSSFQRLKAFLGGRKVEPWEQVQTARLAVLAVGPLSQAKKVQLWWHHIREDDKENPLLKILRDRRPEWIDDWIAAALAGDSLSIDWNTLWELIQEGICQKPTSEDYYRAMPQLLNGWSRIHQKTPVPLSEVLASEPALLDDIWKLFEIDTVAFASEWDQPGHESWPTAILKLAERGHLDRGRLLDATLAGQTTGFKQNILSGFAKLHEQLNPTPDELATRQPIYCDLMSVHLPRVVGFAVKMIKKIDQSKTLDDTAFVAAAPAVFAVTTKGPPKTVISLLQKLAKRRPDLVPQVSRAMIEALNHRIEEVQGAAISWLAAITDQLDQELIQAIAQRLDDLPATIRPQAIDLINRAGGDIEATTAAEADEIQQRLTECRQRAAAIGPTWRQIAGTGDALAALETAGWATPLDFDAMRVPVLSGLEPVEAIASLEELIDAVAHGIEQVDSAIEVERILDGICRFCDQKPDDFDRRVAPLIKRIEKTKDSESARGISNQRIAPRELARIVGTWLAGNANLAKPQYGVGGGGTKDIANFINTRLAAIRQRIETGKPMPLLAAPTHQRGWTHPAAIVARWQEIEQLGSRPSQFEIIQALLRMAPEGRTTALEQAEALTHPSSRALRWALGGDDGPRANDAEEPNLWLAAGRARSARGVLEELSAIGLDQGGPDAIQPARYTWQTDIREQKDHNRKTVYRTANLTISTDPEIHDAMAEKHGCPTVMLHVNSSRYNVFGGGAPWVYDWISMVWPANLDGFFVAGIRCLVRRLDDPSSNWVPNHAFIPPLFDVDRPWSRVAHLMAIIGVAGRDQDSRGLALDALVEAIADGRVHADLLGQTLSTLATPFWLKLNRLGENLAEVARVSPLHAWTIMGALEQLLAGYEELPRDAHYLLALLQELHAQLGLGLQGTAAVKLREVKGASKTAKLAKALCAYAPERPAMACDEARLMVLEARLDRAERWASS